MKIILIIFMIISYYNDSYSQTKEYLLKASFLEKFARFVEWPSENEKIDTRKYFEITILGENPFGSYLDNIAKGKKIKNKAVSIRYINNPEAIGDTHMLFISKSMKGEIYKILRITENKPILTISEISGAAQKGIIINFFFTSRNTVHFEINENKAKLAGLKIDVLLLEIAKIVK